MSVKKGIIVVFIAVVAMVATGCVQTDILVKLKPDGSGTVEQTILLSQELVNSLKDTMASMSEGQEGEGKPPAEPELFKEEELRAGAEEFGQGVTYVSYEKVVTEGFEGVHVIYAFDDINALTVDQSQKSKNPQEGGGENKETITFEFDRGRPNSILVIKQPPVKAAKEKAEAEAKAGEGAEKKELTEEEKQQQEMAVQMMKAMFENMRVSIVLEIEGSVMETNASYVDGNRITVMDLDFNKLLSMEEEFKQFATSGDDSMANARALMKSMPGVKVELEEEIRVVFK